MPIITYGANGRPRVVRRLEQISKMTTQDLIAFEDFLWKCVDTRISQPAVVDFINAIHREIEWRAQDTEFEQG